MALMKLSSCTTGHLYTDQVVLTKGTGPAGASMGLVARRAPVPNRVVEDIASIFVAVEGDCVYEEIVLKGVFP